MPQESFLTDSGRPLINQLMADSRNMRIVVAICDNAFLSHELLAVQYFVSLSRSPNNVQSSHYANDSDKPGSVGQAPKCLDAGDLEAFARFWHGT